MEVAETVRVVEVAPAMVAKLPPVLVLSSHCTVGVGVPVATAVKVAGWPAVTDWLAGLVVTVGAADSRPYTNTELAPPTKTRPSATIGAVNLLADSLSEALKIGVHRFDAEVA